MTPSIQNIQQRRKIKTYQKFRKNVEKETKLNREYKLKDINTSMFISN